MRKEIGLKNRKTKRKIMTSPGLEPGTLSVLDSRDKTNYTNQPRYFIGLSYNILSSIPSDFTDLAIKYLTP